MVQVSTMPSSVTLAEPVPALPLGGTSLPADNATVIWLPAIAMAGLFIDESIIEQPAAASVATRAVAVKILRANIAFSCCWNECRRRRYTVWRGRCAIIGLRQSVLPCLPILPTPMKFTALWPLARQAIAAWRDDYAPSMGAALAYYTLFSIAPMLLIAISVAGLAFGEDAARGQIVRELRGLMGEQGAAAVQALLQNVNRPSQGFVGAAIGTATLLLGAISVFGELQNALDRIWRAPPRAAGAGLRGLLRGRLLSFGMVIGVGFLLMVSLVASAAQAAVGAWWAPWFRGWAVLADLANGILSFALATLAFAMIYKLVPRAAVHWRDVWAGAAATALLFALGKGLLGWYIGTSGVGSAFGAAGSLMVLLVWTYYSAQVFLLGAEFTWVYAHVYGSLREVPAPAPAPRVPSRHAAGSGTPARAGRIEATRGMIRAALQNHEDRR